ncbi:MAG TPA: nuclear transport factor 2 family protein [Phycisphaerae bacterium]|nr:nuclear transport factor 2 family protein [Phycisphaerae bacterium]
MASEEFLNFPSGGDADIDAIRQLAADMARAEVSGDAEFLRGTLSPDIVIMPPGIPAIEGIEACAEWMRGVLESVQREFEVDLTYSTAEITVSGDWAFERGTYCQTLTSRAGGGVSQETGKYLRVYFNAGDGPWKAARIIWNIDGPADEEAP